MKRNDIVELRSRTADELRRMSLDLREEITLMKKDETMSKVKNPNLERTKRKDLARVLTFLGMKGEEVATPVIAKPAKKAVSKKKEVVEEVKEETK